MKETNDSMDHRPDPNFWQDSLKKNPFEVPESYFDQLLDQSTFLSKISTVDQDDFVVPEGYFENLQEQIQSEISLQQFVSKPSPNNTGTSDGFMVDEFYFNKLEAKIKQSIEPQKKSKETRLIRFPVLARYAAAACLLLTSGWFVMNWNTNNNQDVNLQNIPDQDIINYLSVYSTTRDLIHISDAVDHSGSTNSMNDLSEDEIRWFLENSL